MISTSRLFIYLYASPVKLLRKIN